MADLKTECASCAANIVVAEILVNEDEEQSFRCHKCEKLYA